MKKEVKSKSWLPYVLILAASILLIILVTKPVDLSGKAYLVPIHIYGKVMPELPDGINISFKAGVVDIGSTLLKDSKYGYETPFYLKIDDPNTPLKEGYSQNDIINVYIEGVKVSEFSYLESFDLQKDITVIASMRQEVSNKVASVIYCAPSWQCSEWSQCTDAKQTRTCSDINNCRFPSEKPSETKDCGMPAEYEQPVTSQGMGFTAGWLYAGIGIIIIAIIVSALSKRKKVVLQQGEYSQTLTPVTITKVEVKKARKKRVVKKTKKKKR